MPWDAVIIQLHYRNGEISAKPIVFFFSCFLSWFRHRVYFQNVGGWVTISQTRLKLGYSTFAWWSPDPRRKLVVKLQMASFFDFCLFHFHQMEGVIFQKWLNHSGVTPQREGLRKVSSGVSIIRELISGQLLCNASRELFLVASLATYRCPGYRMDFDVSFFHTGRRIGSVQSRKF